MNLTFPFRRLIMFKHVFKHSPCNQHRGFDGRVHHLQKPESVGKISPLANVREVVLQCILLLHFS